MTAFSKLQPSLCLQRESAIIHHRSRGRSQAVGLPGTQTSQTGCWPLCSASPRTLSCPPASCRLQVCAGAKNALHLQGITHLGSDRPVLWSFRVRSRATLLTPFTDSTLRARCGVRQTTAGTLERKFAFPLRHSTTDLHSSLIWVGSPSLCSPQTLCFCVL